MFSWLLGSGQSIPFEIGAEVEGYAGRTIWKLCAGKDKKDGSAVSIFACHLSSERSELEKAAARNALKRFKTIKHPYVLRFVDGMELEDPKAGNTVYIVTEPVTPLELVLKEGALPEAATAWGLRSIVSAIAFLHRGGLMHANVQLCTIFTNRAGDWKLGGFELTTDPRPLGEAAFTAPKELLARKLQPPELSRGQLAVLAQAHLGATDAWLLGTAIYEVFNGRLERAEQLKNTASIPLALAQDYTRLLSGNVPQRLGAEELLRNAFFGSDYCETQQFLENLNVKDANEKNAFFVRLAEQVAGLPPAAAKYKVLPALVQSLEYGGGSAQILTPLLRIAKGLTDEEFQSSVVPIVTKLFANTDRAMRLPLLEHLPSIAGSIPERALNEAIFPHLAQGFTDGSAQLREATVKAVVTVAPFLNHRSLGHVLRAFATLQRDEEPAIRTNTTICLGKITAYLDEGTRQRVLIAAFCRALLDPFAPARRAGALSLAATQAFHSAADAAAKIVPAVAPLTLDPDGEVRKSALQCMQVYMAKLEGESRRMAAREAGVEVAEAPPDALATAASVAQESVVESMTWVSSMLGNLGFDVGKPGPSGGAPGGAGAPKAGGGGMLQPTLAPPPTPQPAAEAHAAGQPAGGQAAQLGAGRAGAAPGLVPSQSQAPTSQPQPSPAPALASAAGSGPADPFPDVLGDADFDTAFSAPPQAPPAPPLSPQSPTPGGSARPAKLGAKKGSASWGDDADFFADLARPPPAPALSAPGPAMAPFASSPAPPQLPQCKAPAPMGGCAAGASSAQSGALHGCEALAGSRCCGHSLAQAGPGGVAAMGMGGGMGSLGAPSQPGMAMAMGAQQSCTGQGMAMGMGMQQQQPHYQQPQQPMHFQQQPMQQSMQQPMQHGMQMPQMQQMPHSMQMPMQQPQRQQQQQQRQDPFDPLSMLGQQTQSSHGQMPSLAPPPAHGQMQMAPGAGLGLPSAGMSGAHPKPKLGATKTDGSDWDAPW